MALSERDKRVLDLERGWWQTSRTKEAAIRERLGLSTTRYYEILAALSTSPDARAYDPLVVHRVRRLRAQRRRARYEGRSAGGGPATR
ncbi:MAG TPA: DUF3263 domain-containing protein [Acidimicrobiales bacterium]|jgi:hypothetical protein